MGGNDDVSPFSAFKKFVDSSFNAWTDGFTKLPENIKEIRAKMQREQERQEDEERDMSRRWTGSRDTPDHISMERARSSDEEMGQAYSATVLLLSEAMKRNQDVPLEKIKALFQDDTNVFGELDRFVSPMLALGGAWYYMPETGDKLPNGESWRWPAPSPQWLSVDWFKRSPYSPIRLEAHPDLAADGSKWREAFEDLMNAALDKPMNSREHVGMRAPYGKPQSTHYGPGLEWLLSLQCRGILPPLLPHFYNASKPNRDDQNSILYLLAHNTQARCSFDFEDIPSILEKDFAELKSEVATKSTADTEAAPLPETVQPETEQDLYDSLYAAQKGFRELASVYKPTLREEQWEEANEELWEALDAKDALLASVILDEWYEKYEDITDLVEAPLELRNIPNRGVKSEWLPVLIDAIRRSELPDDDEWKEFAHAENTVKTLEPGQLPQLETMYQQSLKAQGDELAGRELTWPPLSTEQLESIVERMLEEHENLEQMTNPRKIDRNHVTTLATQTLGILSGLDVVAEFCAIEPNANRERLKKLKAVLEEGNPSCLEDVDELRARMDQERGKAPPPTTPAMKKPDVLSALTTTHTTRLPDGTVTTKVVLKQRFADGREETTESVHTTNEIVEQQHQQRMEDERPKKQGWFWS